MQPTQWLERRVEGFGRLPQPDRDAIRDFGLLWALFEQRVFDTEGANAGKIVAAMAHLQAEGKLDLGPLYPALTYFQDRYFRDGALTERFEKLGLRDRTDRAELVERFVMGKLAAPEEVLASALIIILRFRHNLHHGVKWVYWIEGQLENFQHSNTVLMAVMEMWETNGE